MQKEQNNKGFTLEINPIKISLYLGITEEEQTTKQEISIKILLNFSKIDISLLQDNMANTICYAKIINFIIEGFANKRYNLLETFSYDLKNKLFSYIYKQVRENNIGDFSSDEIKIYVEKKPVITGFSGLVTCIL